MRLFNNLSNSIEQGKMRKKKQFARTAAIEKEKIQNEFYNLKTEKEKILKLRNEGKILEKDIDNFRNADI